jgi:hypothetical protein
MLANAPVKVIEGNAASASPGNILSAERCCGLCAYGDVSLVSSNAEEPAAERDGLAILPHGESSPE